MVKLFIENTNKKLPTTKRQQMQMHMDKLRNYKNKAH